MCQPRDLIKFVDKISNLLLTFSLGKFNIKLETINFNVETYMKNERGNEMADYKKINVAFYVDGEDLETLNNICMLWNGLPDARQMTEDKLFEFAITLGSSDFVSNQLKFYERYLKGQVE